MGQKKKACGTGIALFLTIEVPGRVALPRQPLACQQQRDGNSKEDCENGGSVACFIHVIHLPAATARKQGACFEK